VRVQGAATVTSPSALSPEQRKANVEAVVRRAIADLRGADFESRRRGVMYIPALLGHRIGPYSLRDQPYGVVGQCEHCGQIAKAPRCGDSIEGRAVENICPAATATIVGP
jgi:hypothetical protein